MTEDVLERANDYWWLVNDLMNVRNHYNTEAEFDYSYQSLYGLDQRRTEFHDALCKALNVEKEEIQYITDNLDRYDCFERFCEALEKHDKKKENINE